MRSAVDMELDLGAPSATVLLQREASAKAFDRLMRYEAMLQRSLNRMLADFRSLKREAAKDAKAAGGCWRRPPIRMFCKTKSIRLNPLTRRPPAARARPASEVGETPWSSHEKRFLPMRSQSGARRLTRRPPAAPNNGRTAGSALARPPCYGETRTGKCHEEGVLTKRTQFRATH